MGTRAGLNKHTNVGGETPIRSCVDLFPELLIWILPEVIKSSMASTYGLMAACKAAKDYVFLLYRDRPSPAEQG